jgi:4-aminobutyrate aminotransferase
VKKRLRAADQTTLPGPKSRKIIERDRKVITPAYTRGYPLVIERGEGSYVYDPDGNKFLDFTAGVAVNALGHAHPEIVRVVQEQSEKFIHMAGTDFYYEVMAAFADKLCAIAPGKGQKQIFLANSGTEASRRRSSWRGTSPGGPA